MHLIIVHRLLESLAFPPLNSILLMVIGILLPSKNRKIKSTIALVGLISLYIQAMPIFAYKIATSIEPRPLPNNIPAPDAIIVLSGGINNNGYEYGVRAIVNTSTLSRLRYAAYLAHKYPNTTLILSGGYSGSHYKEAQIMKDTLDSMFGIKNPIIIEANSRNTNENAKFTASLIRRYHFQRVFLISQAYHVKRAMMLFQQNGIYPIAAPTDYTQSDNARTKVMMLIPTARAQALTARTLHEVLGFYLYKFNYLIEGRAEQFLDYL